MREGRAKILPLNDYGFTDLCKVRRGTLPQSSHKSARVSSS